MGFNSGLKGLINLHFREEEAKKRNFLSAVQ